MCDEELGATARQHTCPQEWFAARFNGQENRVKSTQLCCRMLPVWGLNAPRPPWATSRFLYMLLAACACANRLLRHCPFMPQPTTLLLRRCRPQRLSTNLWWSVAAASAKAR